MRLNIFGLNSTPRTPAGLGFTNQGAPAAILTAEQRLRRSVASCFLWEDEFYRGWPIHRRPDRDAGRRCGAAGRGRAGGGGA